MKYFFFLSFILFLSCSMQESREEKVLVNRYHKSGYSKRINSCKNYENFEIRDFQFNWNPYEGLQEAYRVIKEENTFRVFLKIALKSSLPNKAGIYRYEQLQPNLIKKWRECLSSINGKVHLGGQSMYFYLMDYHESREMPIAVISNKSSDFGEDQYWLLDSTCSEILSFTFKLLGLREEKKSEVYSCRSESLPNSVMVDMDEALYQIKRVGHDYTAFYCECDREQSKNCERILSKGYPLWGGDGNLSCPPGSYFIKKYWLKKDLLRWAQKNQEKIFFHDKKPPAQLSPDLICQVYGKLGASYSHCEKAKKENELLYPAQFRSILYPRCVQKNALYESCSENSYRKRGCFKESLCKKGDWLK